LLKCGCDFRIADEGEKSKGEMTRASLRKRIVGGSKMVVLD